MQDEVHTCRMTFPECLMAAMGSMTQRDVAELTGIDDSLISRYVSGKTEPTVGKLARLMRALPQLHGLLVEVQP
jgi:predicted transcriptional regulator